MGDLLKGTKLEQSIFILLCKVSLVASSIFFLLDLFIIHDLISVEIEIVVIGLSFFLLKRAEKLDRLPINRYLFTVIFIIIANLAWITGGGYSVVNFMIYFLIVFSTLLLLPKKAIIVLSLFSLLNISGLYLAEQFFPEFFAQFGIIDDPIEEFMLIIVPFAVGIFLSYNIKKFYLNEYSIIDKQKDQLINNKNDLEENQQWLNETLNNYTNLLDNANDAIIVMDSEAETIEYANTKACELYELKVEDFGIISMRNFTSEEYKDELTMKRFVSEGKLRNYKTTHTNKSGNVFNIEFNATWTYFNGKKRILSINRDVSDRVRLENELEKSYNLYKLLADYSSNIITLHNHKHQIEYVSPFVGQLLGYPVEHLKEIDYYDIIYPEDKQLLVKSMQQDADEGELYSHYEYRIKKEDGGYIWLESRVHRKYDKSGELERYIVNSYDISERKTAQQKLEKSNELYQLLAENSGDIITLYDIDFKLQYVSPSVKDMLGFSVEEFYQITPFSRIHREDIDGLKSGLQLTVEELVPRKILRYRYKNASENYIWLEILVKPMLNKRKKLIGFTSVARDVTELVEKERNLLKISEDLREAQEIAKLGNLSIDLINDLVVWSESTYRILEVDSSEPPFKIEKQLIHPEDVELWSENFKKTLEADIGDFHVRIITPKGNLKYIQVKTRLVRDYNIPTKIVGTIQDVTIEKQIQKEISEKEELLRSIIENDPSMIFMKSLEGEFIVMNTGAAHKLYGKKPEEIIGKRHDQLHDHETETKFIQRQEKILRENWKSVKYEIEYTSPVYGKIFVDMTKIPFEDSNGDKYILGIGIDITKLKLQQKELQLTQERYELATKAGQTGIIDWRPLERHLYFDSEFQNILGYSDAEFPNDSLQFLEYFIPGDEERFNKEILSHIKAKKKDFEGEYQLYHKNGHPVWLLTRGKFFYNEDGKAYRMVSSATDITKIKEYEFKLINTKMELEHASQAKENFFSVMSHEIRTPLNSIIGLSHFLRKKNPNNDQIKILDVLKESSDHLYKLINDVLDYNKIKAGQMVVQKTSFDLHDFLNQNALPYKVQAKEKQLKFRVTIDDSIPKVLKADVFRIKQILDNVISNALKFTNEGTIKLEVKSKSKSGESLWVEFRIIDTGIGIPDKDLETILEPFRQATNQPKENVPGTGLGLSIVKNLTDLLKGKLSVESKKGRGTRISILLPFDLIDSGKKALKKKNKELNSPKSISLKELKILYVEDVASNQFVIESYCSMWGIECQTVNSGKEAIDLLRSRLFDFILMDLHMPEMDGYETANYIRNELGFKQIPIIAFTADVSGNVKNRIRLSGMDGLVSKPVDAERLYALMAEIVDKNNSEKKNVPLLDLSFYQQLAQDSGKPWEVIRGMINEDFEILKSECFKVKRSYDLDALRKALHRIRPVAANINFFSLISEIRQVKEIDSKNEIKIKEKADSILNLINKYELFVSKYDEILS
ncbi:MAG: PAS domain S-box protein [Bacteroidota bacterium]